MDLARSLSDDGALPSIPWTARASGPAVKHAPHLNYHYPLARDKARQNLDRKAQAIRSINPLVIVASEYMANLVRQSIYGDSLRVKVVPFGIEWPDEEEKNASRAALGIPQDDIVIGFRAGLLGLQRAATDTVSNRTIKRAVSESAYNIDRLPGERRVSECGSAWNLLEPGWVSDATIGRYYAAMDIFLMPSRAEAFGMMSIEALAAGALPIVSYGTALRNW